MIPVKLRVRNFMCYRENVPPLYFEGIHTACICGDNGNGKSAIIDAITWALWGKTRAKSDDDLIHLGQREMEVEFDFAVGQQPYRIIRKHAKPKRRRSSGQSSLDFQIAAGDGFKSIAGNSITHTQQKIIDILHMDYSTFINSAFLRQGHADEFTQQPPTKRKEVLANILELSLYDQLEEEAKNLSKQQEMEKMQLESAISDIDAELAQKPTYQAEFEAAQSELSSMEKVIKEQEGKLSRLRQEKETLEGKKAQLAQLEGHIKDTERASERWDEQIRQHHSRLKDFEELFAQRSAIEKGYAELTEAKKLCDALDQKFRKVTTLNERKHRLEMAITEAGQTLLAEHKLTISKIGELENFSQRIPHLKGELPKVQASWCQLAEQEEALRSKRQAIQELQTKVNYLESHKMQLTKEIAEIEEKLKLLLTQTDAKCPLCETELGREGLKLIETKYTSEKQSKTEALKSNQVELERKKTELRVLEKELSQLETRLKQERDSIQSKDVILKKEITEAEEAATKLNEERTKLSQVEQQLARRDFAIAEQEALKELETGLAELAYAPQQHEEIRNRLGDLERYEGPNRKLDDADRLFNEEKEALSRAEESIRELHNSLEADNKKRQELSLEVTSLPQLSNDLAQAENEGQIIATKQRQAQEIMGTVKGKLERCRELEIKRREKGKLLSKASQEEKVYKDLAQAFGKRGIQALLIEIALPEIEAEANRLLARMTDNRMHVKIETQRETKKGDTVETLDIKIADELGIRNYEMFSGGETFRINFAIRIALSKLLARRAGAPLPTLIIDEGFGTQDSAGIEKLKEAINSIQDDFDKILVITHIEELKDAFPTRIDVLKTAEGSTISLN